MKYNFRTGRGWGTVRVGAEHRGEQKLLHDLYLWGKLARANEEKILGFSWLDCLPDESQQGAPRAEIAQHYGQNPRFTLMLAQNPLLVNRDEPRMAWLEYAIEHE